MPYNLRPIVEKTEAIVKNRFLGPTSLLSTLSNRIPPLRVSLTDSKFVIRECLGPLFLANTDVNSKFLQHPKSRQWCQKEVEEYSATFPRDTFFQPILNWSKLAGRKMEKTQPIWLQLNGVISESLSFYRRDKQTWTWRQHFAMPLKKTNTITTMQGALRNNGDELCTSRNWIE